MNFLTKIIKPVYAHCDVPCGIYETDTMRHAAETCIRMTEKIVEIGEPKTADEYNNFVRSVQTKEEHAQLCKDQLYLLWSDYFKPEHLQKFPDLHDIFWNATKQCGKVKQSTSREVAHELLHMVARVDEAFKESKSKCY